MRNKETGEFELVVGNGQLLSGFFIVVLLLAVTFAMGYVVGQNSPRSAKVQAETTAPAAPVEPHQQQTPSRPASAPAEQPPADNGAQAAAADAPPQPTTQPARESASPAAAPAPAPPAPAASGPAAPASASPECAPGTCWQVGAWKEMKQAEILATTLRDRGFPASVKAGADNLMHVMVGPYPDVQSMSRAKSDLESRFDLHPIRK